MPKIFEYLGIIIALYSQDHSPIHFHAKYREHEMIIVFKFTDGKLSYKITPKKDAKPLPANKLKQLNSFVNEYKYEIFAKWERYVIFNSRVKNEVITKKV